MKYLHYLYIIFLILINNACTNLKGDETETSFPPTQNNSPGKRKHSEMVGEEMEEEEIYPQSKRSNAYSSDQSQGVFMGCTAKDQRDFRKEIGVLDNETDSEETESEKTESEKTGSEKTDSEENTPRKTDSGETDTEENIHRETDSEKTGSEKTDSRETNPGENTPRKTDSGETDTKENIPRETDSGETDTGEATPKKTKNSEIKRIVEPYLENYMICKKCPDSGKSFYLKSFEYFQYSEECMMKIKCPNNHTKRVSLKDFIKKYKITDNIITNKLNFIALTKAMNDNEYCSETNCTCDNKLTFNKIQTRSQSFIFSCNNNQCSHRTLAKKVKLLIKENFFTEKGKEYLRDYYPYLLPTN